MAGKLDKVYSDQEGFVLGEHPSFPSCWVFIGGAHTSLELNRAGYSVSFPVGLFVVLDDT